MNKSRYIPFERNRYFYGKLLTVRDFMSEQTYVSDKRRMINRLLYGCGVISGLQVIAIDEKSLTVETGVALDQLGREIVVPSPVTMKLSMLEGFTNNEYAKNVYLCLAYDEKGKEPVHSAAGVSGREEEVSEYNRILESYKLSIREEAPSPAYMEYDHLIEDTSVWYEDAQVRVLQTVPRYLEPGQSFELRLVFEKTLQTPHISFEYEPDWTYVEAAEDLPDGKVKFSEPTDGGRTVYTLTIPMIAQTGDDEESSIAGRLSAKPETVRLTAGDKLLSDVRLVEQGIEISGESAEQRMLQAFYERSLDRAMESPADPCVYLAKINLLQMGATYAIDSVEPMPFGDYVMNPTMLYKILSMQERTRSGDRKEAARVATAADSEQNEAEFPDIAEEFRRLDEEREAEPEKQLAAGVAEISIIPPKKKKWYHRRQRNFFSEEIEHGMGAGAVLITTGLSDERDEMPLPQLWERKDAVYFGSQDVFKKTEHEGEEWPKVTIGLIQYPKKGTFRIGVRVHNKTERTRLRIRWWAVKSVDEEPMSSHALHDPDVDEGEQQAAAAKG